MIKIYTRYILRIFCQATEQGIKHKPYWLIHLDGRAVVWIDNRALKLGVNKVLIIFTCEEQLRRQQEKDGQAV